MGSGPIVDDKPRVKQAYLDNKWRVGKYPYLYEGMDKIEDFRIKFCPRELLRRGRFLECNNVPSIDDGDLARRFELFVRDYSGLDPFDIQYVSSPLSSALAHIGGCDPPISLCAPLTEGWVVLPPFFFPPPASSLA